MGKICTRCSYERQDTDTAPATECPACGVIYARVEAASTTAHQAAQIRLAQQLREQRGTARTEIRFTAFRTMYSPLLIRIAFLLAVVAGGAGAILAVMQEQWIIAVTALLSILVARISLEGVAILFSMAQDLAAVRTVLTDQAANAAREYARAGCNADGTAK